MLERRSRWVCSTAKPVRSELSCVVREGNLKSERIKMPQRKPAPGKKDFSLVLLGISFYE